VFLRWLTSCRPHRRGRLQTTVGHVGPLPRQAAQRGARPSVAARTPVAEQHGLHWLAYLAMLVHFRRRRRKAMQDKVLPQGLRPAEKRGLHWPMTSATARPLLKSFKLFKLFKLIELFKCSECGMSGKLLL